MRTMTNHEVSVSVPGSADYLRLVRLAAADAATRAGFSVDEIEDLRIAVDELCFALSDGDADYRIELSYQVTDSGIEMAGRCAKPGSDFALSELAEMIVSAVVDEFSLEVEHGVRTFRLTKSTAME
jgi:serine/threonine-protein kinase RsbW